MDSSVTTKITLWGKLGEMFDPNLYKKDEGPCIVIVTSTTIKKFQGEVNFSTTSASKIYINLQIDYVASLIERFSTVFNVVQVIESSYVNKITFEEEMFLNRMSIKELLEADWSSQVKEYIVTVRGKISEIDNSCGWYKIHIKVMDKTAEATFVLFNHVAEKLLDTSAHKLFNRLPLYSKDVPTEIQSLCGKDFIYKLKLNDYNLKERLENFTVSKLFTPDEKLELEQELKKDKKVLSTYARFNL
ncbi:Rep fac-A C domain-containing protein [Citrus sinensis]|nr:Rep fac-A C domain-containing protein [Citrus sinensis]